MNGIKSIGRTWSVAIAAVGCFLVSGCVYEVPITPKPTRNVDARLLGNWTANETIKMKVVKLDDSHYIVSYNGDLYRVYHSDVAGVPFFSVRVLEEAKPKYTYSVWKLAEDGTLIGRAVSDKVVPDTTKDSASVRKLLTKNLQNPALLEEEVRFTKDK